MQLAIDGANLRDGGGVTHLEGLLGAADPERHGFSRIVLWAPPDTVERLPDRPWLRTMAADFGHGPPAYLLWHRRRLARELSLAGTDLLFVPGGSYAGHFRPFVTMCRNMLPWERPELERFGFGGQRLRLELLRLAQMRTFIRAQGLVFLTEYARQVVMTSLRTGAAVRTIPHGIEARFRREPRDVSVRHSEDFRLLYVSIVNLYKHQERVAHAVARLRAEGLRVRLDMVGPAYAPALARLRRTMATLDSGGGFLHYAGPVPFSELHRRYREADGFVFASSCENMPNILLEAMSAGLPIACSSRGPMPEVLGPEGLYFDPEDTDSIAAALRRLVQDPGLRDRLARDAHRRSSSFTWSRCADQTFAFLREVRRSHPRPV